MPRYGMPIDESPGMEIFNLMVAYCGDEAVIPNPYAFWSEILVKQKKFPISKGGFTYWLTRLQMPPRPGERPYIERDPVTKAYRLRGVKVVVED